eukprot:scaffold1698_cov149-Skeletonema_menzelii.AAC.6
MARWKMSLCSGDEYEQHEEMMLLLAAAERRIGSAWYFSLADWFRLDGSDINVDEDSGDE